MRVIDFSAPKLKRPRPKISRAVPIMNESIKSVGVGAIEKHKTATINATGKTEAADSRNFWASLYLKSKLQPPFRNLTLSLEWLLYK